MNNKSSSSLGSRSFTLGKRRRQNCDPYPTRKRAKMSASVCETDYFDVLPIEVWFALLKRDYGHIFIFSKVSKQTREVCAQLISSLGKKLQDEGDPNYVYSHGAYKVAKIAATVGNLQLLQLSFPSIKEGHKRQRVFATAMLFGQDFCSMFVYDQFPEPRYQRCRSIATTGSLEKIVSRGHLGSLKLLVLELGEEILTNYGGTPLEELVVDSGKLPLVKYMHEWRQWDDQRAEQLLGVAVRSGNMECIKYMCDEAHAICTHRTVWDAASQNLDILKYIVEVKKAPVDTWALHMAKDAGAEDCFEYLQTCKITPYELL